MQRREGKGRNRRRSKLKAVETFVQFSENYANDEFMLMMKTLIAMIILWVGSMREDGEAESFMRSSASRLNNFLKKQKNSVACWRVIRIWSRRLNKKRKTAPVYDFRLEREEKCNFVRCDIFTAILTRSRATCPLIVVNSRILINCTRQLSSKRHMKQSSSAAHWVD